MLHVVLPNQHNEWSHVVQAALGEQVAQKVLTEKTIASFVYVDDVLGVSGIAVLCGDSKSGKWVCPIIAFIQDDLSDIQAVCHAQRFLTELYEGFVAIGLKKGVNAIYVVEDDETLEVLERFGWPIESHAEISSQIVKVRLSEDELDRYLSLQEELCLRLSRINDAVLGTVAA